MKKIWITSLEHDPKKVQKVMAKLKTYAMDANGHFWKDDLEKMAWLDSRIQLTDKDTALWMILSDDKNLAETSVRYGLAMLALSVQGMKGHGFPILLAHQGQLPQADNLPTPLQGAVILDADNPALGAKVVAKVHTPPKKIAAEYRADIYALPQLGQWFEVGPANDAWEGVLFGVHGAEINAHGVGPAGKLPDKAVVEYPMKGLKIDLRGKEYIAWAVKNRLEADSSYYLRVKGEPESVILGPLSESDDAEIYVLQLQ